MIIRRKIFQKYNDYRFSIDLNEKDRSYVSVGQRIKEGDELYKSVKNNAKYSFYIPDEIKCSLEKAFQYLMCIDGEYVDEGDVLAEKVGANGLFSNKLISPSSGLIDLSRINSGFLDILGEENEIVVKSKFNGVVEDVNPVEGIKFISDAYALDLVAISNIVNKEEGKKISGEFVILGEGKELKFKGDEEDYQNKIVFVGKHLHPNLLQDLFEKGALFVLTCSMDYEEFRKQSLPIGVISGFGDIFSNNEFIKNLNKLDHSFVVMDWDESQAFFVSNTSIKSDTKGMFVRSLVGSDVISRSNSNYGMLGKIVEIQEGNEHVTVEWSNKNKSITHIALLEFVSV